VIESVQGALATAEDAIRFVCRRNRCRADEAEDFGSVARIRLLEDDCAILRRHEGRSSLKTYLVTVIQRQFIDYRRQKWGKWRPAAAARRMGELGIRLDTLLNRDGLSFDEACEVLRTSERRDVAVEQLAELAAKLPQRGRPQEVGEESLASWSTGAEATEAPALRAEQALAARRVRRALSRAMESLQAQDRLILRMRFADEFTVGDIARALALAEKPLYRRIERLLGQLRGALEAGGVRASDVMEGLQGWDWELAGGPGSADIASVSVNRESRPQG
jgi:RNA polymerase sigma factor (sigma-70 family)